MKYWSFLVMLAAALVVLNSQIAVALSVSQTPLFIGSSVDPNVFFQVDDSGSMDWTILSKKYWHPCAYDPDSGQYDNSSSDCGYLVETGNMRAYGSGWKYFYYVYDSPDDVYDQSCGGSYPAAENCSDGYPYTENDWRMRASAVNVLYYDPSVNYKPWPGFSNASFTAARSNPQSGTTGYSSTRNLTNIVYEVASDDSGFSGSRPRRGIDTNKTSVPNGLIDLWDSHKRVKIGSTSVTIQSYRYDAIDTEGTELSLNPSVSSDTLSGSDCFEELGGGEVACRTIDQAKQNIANWYQYYRRRSFVAKAAIGEVIEDSPHYRFGLNLINQSSTPFVEMPSAATTDYSTHNSALLSQLYSYRWRSNGTPLRNGLNRVGLYYKGNLSGKDSPITERCQHNFTLLLTDGYWNGGQPSDIGDADGDERSVTVADVARYYYKNDLRTDLDNEVPTSDFDTASYQHMVTYGVAFGVYGDLVDTDGDGWPNPALSESDDWGDDPTACSSCPAKIDDMWHASYNSRGTFVQAQTPSELVDSLKEAMSDIASRTATAAAIATNSTRLTDGSLIYQARFDSGDWSGQIIAYKLDSETGAVAGVGWNTDDVGKIPNYTVRNIFTYNGSSGVPFREGSWADLTSAQRLALQNGGTEQQGKDRLNWLRGDPRLEEDRPDGYLRERSRPLGDIVNSDPLVVGALNFNYQDLPESAPGKENYEAFLRVNRSRTKMLYVGANDGMLHAFRASDGVEQFAYVPEAVFGNLAELTDPDYSHVYYVDGSAFAGDAYVDGEWKTILIGGLNAGGRSVYAIDITKPDAFGAGNVLWEFSHEDLGYTYGQAVVCCMKDGTWVAIFGNGYGSDNHKACLFIVDLKTGQLIRKIDTGIGSAAAQNGLSTPALLANRERIIEYAYAGDLQGNLWKFDLSSKKGGTDWDVAFEKNVSGNKVKVPLFQARGPSGLAQPITAPLEIGTHSKGGYMIYFGTGKYLETGDNVVGDDTPVQSFYGIHDGQSGYIEEVDRSTLVEQKILTEFDYNDTTWRISSGYSDDAFEGKDGWFMDLLSPVSGVEGERVVSVPMLRWGRVIFVTLIPSQDPCSGGGSSWLMEMQAETGNSPDVPVFDTDGDGDIDENDVVIWDVHGDPGFPSGRKIDGIIDTPAVVTNGKEELKNAGTSTGDIVQVLEPTDLEDRLGRRSWREIR